ncbi:hypothetical protein PGT21_024079 [Puccinia graminis f. sp. tritici]|uniref:Uncharacterized protein n=1 Tax=Puccinia graminis f. sp. tritici TaxID=56615 RepID=A0A5B0LZT4_PUCGR|nr:hypothetical protein PGT21_024079 [Puccinia graminis f. sp. tritici]
MGRVRVGYLLVGPAQKPDLDPSRHVNHMYQSGLDLYTYLTYPQSRFSSPYPTLPDPNPNHPKTGSDSGSRIPFLSRPDPPRDLCRVGFGHGFSARTRPTYTLTPSDTTYFFQLEERNQLR